MSEISVEEMREFLQREFPQGFFELEAYEGEFVLVRRRVNDRDLRPGGTISGPSMMALADCAIYVAILRRIGLVALAVTTSFNINFLRKPVAGVDLIGHCRLLKLGKNLAVAEVSIYSEGDAQPVAHATGTYSIPPTR